MSDTITITGIVGTVPRHVVTNEGLHISSFRLASTQRKFDRAQNKWVDAETNWYTVSTFRQLAANVANSLSKGDRVIATGRLRVRDWVKDERSGSSIDIEADAVGHDLSWGTSTYSRTMTASPEAAADAAPSPEPSSETSASSQESVPVPF